MPRPLTINYQVAADSKALAELAAEYFVEQSVKAVAKRGLARIAISGGSTPKAVFEILADPRRPWFARMPWSRIQLFWVDERCVSPDHPDSNYRMTREALLDHVPLAEAQIHRMEGELAPEVAAARYESELRNSFRLEGAETPRFDLIALGMGPDGHTASIFPSTEAIYEMTKLVTANHVPQKDCWRITLTWPVINQASSVFFLLGGADKASLLKQVLLGPHDPDLLPSQLIQPASGILTLLLDRGAAAELPATDRDGHGRIEREQ
jgi:6-phosphogluconolactonase